MIFQPASAGFVLPVCPGCQASFRFVCRGRMAVPQQPTTKGKIMARYLLISYDLKKPGRDYSGLTNVIKVIGGISTIHLLESAWLVSTTLSIKEVMTRLKVVTDFNDRIVITELSNIGWHNLEPLTQLRLQNLFR